MQTKLPSKIIVQKWWFEKISEIDKLLTIMMREIEKKYKFPIQE